MKTLAAIRKDVAEKFKMEETKLELSMGMSGDFEQAIVC